MSEDHLENQTKWVGVALILTSHIFFVSALMIEERILDKYCVDNLTLTGLSAVFSSILMILILIILSFIPCKDCEYGKLEDIWLAF